MCRINELAQYDFQNMTWDLETTTGGVVGIWTVSSLVNKATGVGSGPMAGYNNWTMVDGKVTKVTLQSNSIGKLTELFGGSDIGVIQAALEEWGAGKRLTSACRNSFFL